MLLCASAACSGCVLMIGAMPQTCLPAVFAYVFTYAIHPWTHLVLTPMQRGQARPAPMKAGVCIHWVPARCAYALCLSLPTLHTCAKNLELVDDQHLRPKEDVDRNVESVNVVGSDTSQVAK